MAMNVGGSSGDDEPMMEINTTPLIDVMLVLIIMLIITIPIQTHSVKLEMPRDAITQPPPDEKPEVVDLEIDFDGTVFWNGSAVPNTALLDEYLTSAARSNPQPEIHLNPNRLVKYDYVARVLASAQRLGVTRIGFVGNERYMD